MSSKGEKMLTDLFQELETIENWSVEDQTELRQALEEIITRFKEKNMKGYVYVIYVGDNLYKIGMTANLERRFYELNEGRVVRLIKAENISKLEDNLHKRFRSKRVTNSQELFKLNDQDIMYIQTLPDEWEDESRIF